MDKIAGAPSLALILFVSGRVAAAGAGFVDVADELGLVFVHDPAVEGQYFMPESIGSGGAFLDYDGDGDLDVYLLNGAHRSGDGTLRNRLFRQEADGTFRDVTETSGLGDAGYGMGVAVGDVDRDGDADVYVTNYGADALFRNRGDGTFAAVTAAAGIDNPDWGASAVFFDAEGDGDLDLYVVNYLRYSPPMACADFAGRPDYCGPTAFSGLSDRLFLNDGEGRFTDVSEPAGITRASSRGLGVAAADFDGDRRLDLYVANDGEPNHLWIRRGDGGAVVFEDQALLMGAAVNALGRPEAGMGVACGDVDGDGGADLFVTHLRTETNTFYKSAGELGFVDATAAAGLGGASFPHTGFGTGFFDADNDGDLDLAVANGRVTRGPLLASSAAYWDHYAEPNFLFANDGHGRFRDVSAEAGDFSKQVDNSRGLAFGDVDGDGDVDVLVTNGGGPARLLRNELAGGRSWLEVRVLDGAGSDALGAAVTVETGERRLHRRVAPGQGFLSSGDPRVHVGLGGASAVDRLEVHWPGGAARRVGNVPVSRRLVVGAPKR